MRCIFCLEDVPTYGYTNKEYYHRKFYRVLLTLITGRFVGPEDMWVSDTRKEETYWIMLFYRKTTYAGKRLYVKL